MKLLFLSIFILYIFDLISSKVIEFLVTLVGRMMFWEKEVYILKFCMILNKIFFKNMNKTWNWKRQMRKYLKYF